MNPDTPSMETCKRLAAAGFPQEFAFPGLGIYREPTIGEMLAEVTRRSWGISLHRACGNGYWSVYLNYRVGQQAVAHNQQFPAEALALALCDAIEEAKNGTGT